MQSGVESWMNSKHLVQTKFGAGVEACLKSEAQFFRSFAENLSNKGLGGLGFTTGTCQLT